MAPAELAAAGLEVGRELVEVTVVVVAVEAPTAEEAEVVVEPSFGNLAEAFSLNVGIASTGVRR